MDDQHPVSEYEFLPTLPELCERSLEEVKNEISYIFTLYGLALGYLASTHPAKAWLALGKNLLAGLAEITPKDWETISMNIADKLEERATNK